jgi:hypothetical protein
MAVLYAYASTLPETPILTLLLLDVEATLQVTRLPIGPAFRPRYALCFACLYILPNGVLALRGNRVLFVTGYSHLVTFDEVRLCDVAKSKPNP